MQLRVASSDGGPRLNILQRHRSWRESSTLLVATVCLCAAACTRPARARDLTFDWTLTPAPISVGNAQLQLRVLDGTGQPVRGAHLQVAAQMSHPGMAPVVAIATERGDGRYDAELQFSMAGDWMLIIEGSLSNGAPVHHRLDVPSVRSV